MSLRAVVFDLDYTLAVPERDRASILSATTAATGAPDISREEYLRAHRRSHTHETRAPIFETLLADREAEADSEALAGEYRRRIADALVPVDGAEGLVRDLRADHRVGLLTNGPVTAQRDKLATLGWTDLFDATVVTGELAAGKPDPGAFYAVLDALDVPARATVYVGDDVEADVGGATDAGMRAVQVCASDGPDADPRAVAHVDRERLAARLPGVLDALD